LNFDGASKGNLGDVGSGGVFRDHKGEWKLMYASNLGTKTKNYVEMLSLLLGLMISWSHGF